MAMSTTRLVMLLPIYFNHFSSLLRRQFYSRQFVKPIQEIFLCKQFLAIDIVFMILAATVFIADLFKGGPYEDKCFCATLVGLPRATLARFRRCIGMMFHCKFEKRPLHCRKGGVWWQT